MSAAVVASPTAVPCQGMPGCQRPAKLNCVACQLNLCALCDHAVHRSMVIRDHARTRLDPRGCDGECDCTRPVTVHCDACQLKLCVECDQMVHRSACLRDHTRVASDTDEKHEPTGVVISHSGSTGSHRTGSASTPAAELARQAFKMYVV